MRATDVQVGDEVDWRGQRARIVEAWKDGDNPEWWLFPVGVVLEVIDDTAEDPVRFRVVWPDLDAREIGETKRALRDPELAPLAQERHDAVLELHLTEIELEVWSA
jgi:hypothetical protein